MDRTEKVIIAIYVLAGILAGAAGSGVCSFPSPTERKAQIDREEHPSGAMPEDKNEEAENPLLCLQELSESGRTRRVWCVEEAQFVRDTRSEKCFWIVPASSARFVETSCEPISLRK